MGRGEWVVGEGDRMGLDTSLGEQDSFSTPMVDSDSDCPRKALLDEGSAYWTKLSMLKLLEPQGKSTYTPKKLGILDCLQWLRVYSQVVGYYYCDAKANLISGICFSFFKFLYSLTVSYIVY